MSWVSEYNKLEEVNLVSTTEVRREKTYSFYKGLVIGLIVGTVTSLIILL